MYRIASPSHAGVLTVFTMVRAWEGVSERQWRSGANRSPLPLRSVLDAPHRGAGPEPAGETGVGREGRLPQLEQSARCGGFFRRGKWGSFPGEIGKNALQN